MSKRVVDADAMLNKITELKLCKSIHMELSKFVRESTLPDPAPLKRLEWTRLADGTLRSDKIGEAWWEIPGKGMPPKLYRCLGTYLRPLKYRDCDMGTKRAMEVAELYLAALGLGPAPPEPWTPPVIRDERKPDPVAEIRMRWSGADIASPECHSDVEFLLARIDELEKERGT